MKREIILIAEIGENHIGDMKLARRMVRDAAEAGADFVKFQSYLGKDFKKDDPEKEWFKKVELSDEAHLELKVLAEQNSVEFLSSPFTLERAKFLCEELGLRKIKIASGMMLNITVLDYLDSEGIDTVFVSTGMATLEEINQCINHLKNIPNIYLLHCVTQYPCKDEEANLRAILTLQKKFNLPVGYSDHTIGSDACIAAAALGAKAIEKHFTFDKNCPEGTDHVLSVTADEFKEMAEKIRKIEVLLGDGIKEPSEGEKEILGFVRGRFPR
jgi:N,N'-diacetyllegionaminate synthase